MPGHILALDYLDKWSFGVPSKTMLARELLEDRLSWGRDVYAEVLRVWNGFYEETPRKTSLQDFLEAFDDMLCDMQHGNFDWERSPIPTFEGRICNGRHRFAAALVLGTHIRTKDTGEGACDVDWQYFDKLGLDPLYMDSIAIEFCRLKPQSRIAAVFGEHSREEVLDALGIESFYEKSVNLSGQGPYNLIRELYHGEDWLDVHGVTKARLCYNKLEGPLRLYVLDVRCSDMDVRAAKERARHQLGSHGIHINDTHEETMRLARALLNDNGIHFLNHALPAGRGVPAEVVRPGVAIDSGSVLEAYGLRGSSDVDYVDDPMHHEYQGGANFDDPRNYFWSRGVKYASLPAIMRMKRNRNEQKDQDDIQLMRSIL